MVQLVLEFLLRFYFLGCWMWHCGLMGCMIGGFSLWMLCTASAGKSACPFGIAPEMVVGLGGLPEIVIPVVSSVRPPESFLVLCCVIRIPPALTAGGWPAFNSLSLLLGLDIVKQYVAIVNKNT
jgi:hypothetical protein